jgi:hypothetical protein
LAARPEFHRRGRRDPHSIVDVMTIDEVDEFKGKASEEKAEVCFRVVSHWQAFSATGRCFDFAD